MADWLLAGVVLWLLILVGVITIVARRKHVSREKVPVGRVSEAPILEVPRLEPTAVQQVPDPMAEARKLIEQDTGGGQLGQPENSKGEKGTDSGGHDTGPPENIPQALHVVEPPENVGAAQNSKIAPATPQRGDNPPAEVFKNRQTEPAAGGSRGRGGGKRVNSKTKPKWRPHTPEQIEKARAYGREYYYKKKAQAATA